GKPVLLLFTNPNCGPCLSLMPEVVHWHRDHAPALRVVLVSEGSVADNRAKVARRHSPPVLVQKGREVAEAYEAYGTPAAVLVRPAGTAGSPLAMGVDRVRALVRRCLAPEPAAVPANGPGRVYNGHRLPAPAPALRPGDVPPDLTLQDPDGRPVPLAGFRGRP